MTTILNYLIEANIALILILAFYLLFLRKETNFSLLRYFLLAGIMGAVLFPLIHIETTQSNVSPLSIGQVLPSYWLPEVVIGGEATANVEQPKPLQFWTYAGAIYLAGLIYLCVALIFQLADLLSIRKTARASYRMGNIHVAESTEDKPTFSFFNFIFIGRAHELSADEKLQIIQHERVHAAQWHSFDILLVNVLKIFFWFNPFVNTYKKILIQLHEFEADARAVDHSEVDKYCNLLARVALKSADFKLANHFNNSLTVKRIEMMRTIKTNIQTWRLMAVALTLPLVFFFVACQDQVGDEIKEITQNSTHALIIPEQVQEAFDAVQRTYPDRKYILLTLNEAATERIDDLKDQYGLPSSITVLKTSNGEIIEASQSRTQDASMLKAHDPAKKGDLQTFAIVEFNDETSRMADASQEGKIYTVVQKQPEYPGGYDAMVEFIRTNMQYPADAKQQGHEGTVYVSFIVDVDGRIYDTKVIKGVSASCDAEAKRVVDAFPNWIPGQQNKQNVAVRFVLPVKFKI